MLTTADLRALRDFLVASGDAIPVGQVTVIIPTARFEMARTTRRATIRNPGTLSRAKKPGPKPRSARGAQEEHGAGMVLAKCHFCKREVPEAEYRCEGCQEVVCDQCDELAPWGAHDVFEHTADGSDDD